MRNFKSLLSLLIVCALFALAGCGTEEIDASLTDPDPEPSVTVDETDTSTEDPEADDPEADNPALTASEPPPVVLTRGDNTVTLMAWTYCWTPLNSEDGVCSDGAPPENPLVLEGEGPITVTFPIDYNFLATLYNADYTAEVGKVPVVDTDAGWEITPTIDGPAVLEIFGNGPGGDVIVSVAIN